MERFLQLSATATPESSSIGDAIYVKTFRMVKYQSLAQNDRWEQ